MTGRHAAACLSAVLLLAALAPPVPAVPPPGADAAADGVAPALLASPLVALDPQTRDVAGCGVRIDVVAGSRTLLRTALSQQRQGEQTRVSWCVARTAGPADEAPGAALLAPGPLHARLAVPGIDALEVALAAPAADGGEVCVPVQASAGLLFQRLVIGGATLSLDDGQNVRALELRGPLPVAISRTYLNCAGDLFRPEDDEAPAQGGSGPDVSMDSDSRSTVAA